MPLCSRIAFAASAWMRLQVSTKESKYTGDTSATMGSNSSLGRSMRVSMARGGGLQGLMSVRAGVETGCEAGMLISGNRAKCCLQRSGKS